MMVHDTATVCRIPVIVMNGAIGQGGPYSHANAGCVSSYGRDDLAHRGTNAGHKRAGARALRVAPAPPTGPPGG